MTTIARKAAAIFALVCPLGTPHAEVLANFPVDRLLTGSHEQVCFLEPSKPRREKFDLVVGDKPKEVICIDTLPNRTETIPRVFQFTHSSSYTQNGKAIAGAYEVFNGVSANPKFNNQKVIVVFPIYSTGAKALDTGATPFLCSDIITGLNTVRSVEVAGALIRNYLSKAPELTDDDVELITGATINAAQQVKALCMQSGGSPTKDIYSY